MRRFHGRFAPLFGRPESRRHALGYLRGLLLAEGRKSVEPMALMFGGPGGVQPEIDQSIVLSWQRFLTVSPWKAWAVQQEIQAVFNEEFVPTAGAWAIGTVGVIDESSFVKRGSESVGVQRQWCGRLGKEENCQVGVFLLGATPAGNALLDHQLYLPESWAADLPRRKKNARPRGDHVPDEAADRDGVAARSTVRFDWVTADEGYGRDGGFLDALEQADQRYLVEIPCNTAVWTTKPMRQTPDEFVRQVRHLVPMIPERAWELLKLREGAKGPVAFELRGCGSGRCDIATPVPCCGSSFVVRWKKFRRSSSTFPMRQPTCNCGRWLW